MARVYININGVKKYLDDEGRIHRDDGPALITNSGTLMWFRDGIHLRSFLNNGCYQNDLVEWNIFIHKRSIMMPNGGKSLVENGVTLWPEL